MRARELLGRSAPSTVGYCRRKWATNASMTASRGSFVWERTGSTRLFALVVPLSDSFSRPIRSTWSILSASMS